MANKSRASLRRNDSYVWHTRRTFDPPSSMEGRSSSWDYRESSDNALDRPQVGYHATYSDCVPVVPRGLGTHIL